MMRKILTLSLIASVSLSLTGCFAGRSSVVASQYASKPYDIYLNGRHICTMGSDEDCSFQTRGTRAGGILEAYLDGEKVGVINVHRSITIASLLWAPFTYLTSLWLYQAYPDEIEIPIDTYVLRYGGKEPGFDNGSRVSVWDRPVNISKKTKKQAPVEESVEEAAPETVRDGATEEQNEPAVPTKSSVWD